jgi:alkaline phosphatase D
MDLNKKRLIGSSAAACTWIVMLIAIVGCENPSSRAYCQSQLPEKTQRTWIGPQYWANPLQDWQLNNGRIECVQSGGDRNVFLLTGELTSKPGTLHMTVDLGRLTRKNKEPGPGWVGFKLGVRGQFDDYRDNAVRGNGFKAGISTKGKLFIQKYDESAAPINTTFDKIALKLYAEPDRDTYTVTLSALDSAGKLLSKVTRDNIDPDWLIGGLALVCSNGKIKDDPEKRPPIDDGNWGFRDGTGRGGNVRFWFANWNISGSKVETYPERLFGPILFSQYTLSNGIMKMTAQMPPVAGSDSQFVALQIKEKQIFKTLAKARIDKLARTANFRIDNWPDEIDTPYRLVYEMKNNTGQIKNYYWQGTVRKDPIDKTEIVVAAFTGNNDLGFPNNDLVNSVAFHDPDLLFFSGDQIYEGVGGYGVQIKPLEKACNDYLRKWYLYGWAYRDLMKDRPTVSIPDDHDVYHGNLWGAEGRPTPKGLNGNEAQDSGGYKMPPKWVNMVQRTQTSHLPDPYDPKPVKQGISVYYCNMDYAGISFAIIEDRKFKSAPKVMLPEAEIINGWPQNLDFDVKANADIPGAKLLGDRQLKFLDDWSTDWDNGIWMKSVLSQTIFANVATLPVREISDANVPRLRILNEDDYPPNDKPVSDFDSNGWPQTGRNKALQIMRTCFAFHIAGDQHLGSTIQYGVDDYRDAGFAFCAPAISNVWPRRWYPSTPGGDQKTGAPKYTGNYQDGFGNKMTVHAVSNPIYTGLEPSRLYDRATGYGIVRFNKALRQITVQCWPRLSDPSGHNVKQYPGWPVIFNQADNYNKTPAGFLPAIDVTGTRDPVVQLIDEETGLIVYTLRFEGTAFTPKVFKDGTYTLKVGDPPKIPFKTFKHLRPKKTPDMTNKYFLQF